MQARLDVVFGHPHHLRDFARRQTFHLPQKHHGSVGRGQRAQGSPQAAAKPGVVRQLLRVPGWIRRVDRHHMRVASDHLVQRSQPGRFARSLPPSNQAGIAHRAIEPRFECARVADTPDVSIRLDQRLLHRILGIVGMTAHRRAESPGGLLRPHQESLERLRVASRRSTDQVGVLVPRRVRRHLCFYRIHFCRVGDTPAAHLPGRNALCHELSLKR